ncbi:MAG TPA: inorganic diphosphatase [Candidatus Acidoferrum sp.]|nr:inorganic diphosphatase [Candidatus Acidoferrum sp.]
MTDLADLPAFGANGEVHVVVESPRGSTVKLKYEPQLGTFSVSRSLPLGLAYPFDWGFVPGTLGDDGDPVDALVVHDGATFPGVVLPCNLLGVVELSQRGDDGGRERNDRLIAMPVWHDRLGELERATELPARLRREIEQFFLDVTFLTGKKPRIVGWRAPKKAHAIIKAGLKSYRHRRESQTT